MEASAAPVRFGRPPAPPAPLYPAFVRTALGCTLTLGTLFGAFNLLVIHWALPLGTPPSHHWTHAGFQIWGFVFLFIAGIAFEAVPRFLMTGLRFPRLARWVPALTVAGQLLLNYGRLGELLPGTLPALVLGTLLQLAAVAIFVGVIGATARAARPRLELSHLYLGAGTLGWLVAAFCLGGGAVTALLERDGEAAISWNQAVYAAALFSGTLGWIQGMFLRAGSSHLGLGPVRRRPALAALWLGQGGAALMLFGALRHPISFPLLDAGLFSVALSIPVYVFAVRPFSGRGDPADPGLRLCLGMTMSGALLFTVLGAGVAVLDLSRGAPGLLFDGARHAYTSAFVLPFIFAMASRILPAFRGAPLGRPGWRTSGIVLIVAGAWLREAQVLTALFQMPVFMKVSGFSGLVSAAGVLLASLALLEALRRR